MGRLLRGVKEVRTPQEPRRRSCEISNIGPQLVLQKELVRGVLEAISA